MIRFTPAPADASAICVVDECAADVHVYVWDDEGHEPDHEGYRLIPGLCADCWHGAASCANEAHLAGVVRDVSHGVLPA